MARKKPEGIETLRPKQDPVSIQEITLLDWYAGFALMAVQDLPEDMRPHAAFKIAEEMLQERAIRI